MPSHGASGGPTRVRSSPLAHLASLKGNILEDTQLIEMLTLSNKTMTSVSRKMASERAAIVAARDSSAAEGARLAGEVRVGAAETARLQELVREKDEELNDRCL